MATQAADPVTSDFATRLALACRLARAPAHGRQAWLRRRLAEAGATVSAQAVNRWFKGAAMPTRGKEGAVAAALDVSPAWLFAREAAGPVNGAGESGAGTGVGDGVPSFGYLLMNAPFDGRDLHRSDVPLNSPDF